MHSGSIPDSAPNPAADLSPTKRALLALKHLQLRVEELEYGPHEPIAIVGMGCRLPGGVSSPAEFWQLLRDRRDAITDLPPDRWDWSQLNLDNGLDLGLDLGLDRGLDLDRAIGQQGGFVPDLFDFDASFFRIAPREAISLDPQQRLLLEVSWEALEHAGLAADRLVGSRTGVFVGICSIDYWQRLLHRDLAEMDAYLTTGNTHSLAAGRISYVFGFTGPSLAIDAACASSLVAVHLACQSLRQRECDLALAGGVNRILEPATSLNFAKARMLSVANRCKTFDAAADGFVRSEGGGMVVLKRWRDAVQAGDPIWAVILGSAVNHDGRASGLTVPNGVAQQDLIRQALQQSRIDPSQVSYVETHGTGTALGDPIEVNALAALFAARSPDRPLQLGAVKTNIGHLEAAAGIAGLLKTVLALHHQEIPANLHFQTPNPQIDWTAPIQVPTQPLSWQQDEPLIAGVSAFGFNGTNAHLIVADRPPHQPPPSLSPAPAPCLPALLPTALPHLLTISAKTEAALQALIDRYCDFLIAHPDLSLSDLCHTAFYGRSHFPHRVAVVAHNLADLQQKLQQLALGKTPPQTVRGKAQLSAAAIVTDRVSAPVDQLIVQAERYVRGEIVAQGASQRSGKSIVLPTYPFQRQPYGIERNG